MNTLPQITYVYDRQHRAAINKKAAIEMRITFQGKQKYISTGIKIYPSQWKKGEIIGCQDAMQLNQILANLLIDVRQIILDMIRKNALDISLISERLRQLHSTSTSFIEFCRQRSTIRKYGKTKDSQQRYDRFIRLFEDWGKIMAFDDITDKNIIAYDYYLIKKGLKPYSKWNNYHRFLNSFIMDAIDDGLISRNPYRWVNIERGDKISNMNKYLTFDEFQKIKDAIMPTNSLSRVRDLFVFQTYTCLSYSDMKLFAVDKIKDIKGTKVYINKRKKTGKTFIVPLMRPALEILDKYNNRLPLISNVNYNAYLKIVAQAAGIDKPISTHWARHTGATLLLNEGVDMRIVSKICGHSSTRITEQVYAKLLDETVVDAIMKINK